MPADRLLWSTLTWLGLEAMLISLPAEMLLSVKFRRPPTPPTVTLPDAAILLWLISRPSRGGRLTPPPTLRLLPLIVIGPCESSTRSPPAVTLLRSTVSEDAFPRTSKKPVNVSVAWLRLN